MGIAEHVAEMQRKAASKVSRETPALPPPPIVEEKPDRSDFEARANEAAEMVYDWIAGLEPLWGERLQIMRDERGLTKLQCLGSLIAYPLEHALHMTVVQHPAFEGTLWQPGGKLTCPNCAMEYEPPYPGMPYCGGACAAAYRAAHPDAA